MTAVLFVLVTTFLASAVEAIEMVTIVLGVGATRGWRATIVGAVAGFGVLAVIVVVAGLALSRVPIGPLRLVVGALLLVFGLQWFRKGVIRVAAHGLAGFRLAPADEPLEWTGPGLDWTAFVLAFAAVVVIGAIGLILQRVVTRIPRSLLQLVVGILLTTFGTFWSLEGLGVEWPAGDGAILGLLALYLVTAGSYISIERRRVLGFSPGA